MAKIFISYRREDSQHAVDRLQTAIRPYLKNPKRDLFIDVDNIPIGVDFERHLKDKVGQCEAVLAVIGPRWLEARTSDGRRRLDLPDDFVRTEIAAALQRGIPVVPVLLDGTPMPRADDLPGDLKDLVKRNGAQLDRKSFPADVNHIMQGLGLGKSKTAVSTTLMGSVVAIGLLVGGVWVIQQSDFLAAPVSEPSEVAITEPARIEQSEPPEAAFAEGANASLERDDRIRTALVERLQAALYSLYYYDGAIDGQFGPETRSAYDWFAAENDLPLLQSRAPDTDRLEQLALRAEEVAAELSKGGTVTKTQPQNKAELIRRYQLALWQLGYYEGAINGLADDATQDAATSFVKKYGLTNLGLSFAQLDAINRQVEFAEDLASNIDENGIPLGQE